MVGGFFSDIKDKVFKLAEGLVEIPDDTKQNWKDYFISSVVTIQNTWDEVTKQHETLIKNREILCLPKFDKAVNIEAAVVNDPSIAGWTEDDEAYLGKMYAMVDKVVKYASELQQGKREIAWDPQTKDATLLGTELEPAIFLDPQGNFQLVNWDTSGGPAQIVPASYLSGVGAIPVPVIILYAIIAVGVTLIIWKGLDVLKDHLARAEAKDIRDREDKHIKALEDSGVPPKEAMALAQGLTLATNNSIAQLEAARKQPSPELDTFKTIAWAALGITAVGGAIYAIYKFTGSSDKETVREVIRSEPALSAAEAFANVKVKNTYRVNYGLSGETFSNRRETIISAKTSQEAKSKAKKEIESRYGWLPVTIFSVEKIG